MHKILPALMILVLLIVATVFFYLPVKRFVVYKLGISGDPTTSCCSEKDVLASSGLFEENASIAIFDNQIIDYPKTSLALADQESEQQNTTVLGTTNAAGEEKRIEVSLLEQKLRAFEGNKLVTEFLISSGLWNSTPRGTYNIWYKVRNQRMTGGSKELGTYYSLPNVPNNMYFYKGYAIHGAYWHNNFGHPMSHGCINEPLAFAAQLFEWAGPVVPPGQGAIRATPDNPGTKVIVY